MDRFIAQPESDIWNSVLELYEDTLSAKSKKMKADKGKELLKLDKWFQEDLTKMMSNRNEKYITHDELSKLMTWKLTRGKFRPRLQQLAESNSPDEILSASKKAFKALPKISVAIQALTVLKGIGPATASGVLTVGRPDLVAFMADESMLALGIQPLQYTLPAYLSYAEKVKDICRSLQSQIGESDWTPHKVELALWTFYMAKTLCPEKIHSCFPTVQKRVSTDENPGKFKPQKKSKTK